MSFLGDTRRAFSSRDYSEEYYESDRDYDEDYDEDDEEYEEEKSIKGFANPDAILTGLETRSSSPVQITRDENKVSNIKGLYPCGEGAGYAGGIMSAAVDGIKCAIAVLGCQ